MAGQATPKRERPWLMRTYSGHTSARASNELYRKNLAKGQTGLSVAFDLPTQTGYDSDHALAKGEVGKVGVPICHIEDMEALFEAVYVSVSRELMGQTMAVLQRTPLVPEQLAEAALRTFLEFIREDPRRARVMLIDAFTVGPGIQRISAESNSDFATVISNFIEMLFPDLHKVGLNPVLIGNGLVGSNVRLATMWVEEKCATPLEDMLRNMLAIFTASTERARRLMAEVAATPPTGG